MPALTDIVINELGVESLDIVISDIVINELGEKPRIVDMARRRFRCARNWAN